MNLLIFLGVILFFIIIGLFIYFLIIKFAGREEITDDTIFRNFMPQYSEGYSQGVIVNIDIGTERTGIKFFPRDIDYIKIFKKKEKVKIEPLTVYFDNRKLIHFPKGILSAHRNEVWGLPLNPEDLPERFKETEFGKLLIEIMNKAELTKTEIESIREGANRIKDIINRQGDGETSLAEFIRIDEIYENKLKSLMKPDEKKSSFSSPTSLNFSANKNE